jgi:uncharacterized protein with NRDE domain
VLMYLNVLKMQHISPWRLSPLFALAMCVAIIIRNYSLRFPLIILHSREEDIDRPTSPLTLHDGILSAMDLKANGVAAVGLNVQSGRFALLTNCRYLPGLNPSGTSRGSFLTSILTHAVSDIPDVSYQGFFHLYFGTPFEKGLTYISNVDNVSTCLAVPSAPGLDVIVRSNEHPKTDDFFSLKKLTIKESLLNALKTNPDLPSVEEVANLIQSTLTSIDSSLPVPPDDESYSWSLLSEKNEKFVLSHFFIPPISVSDSHRFGTVSQTLIVSNSEQREVHYWYKAQPDWLWDKRVVHISN